MTRIWVPKMMRFTSIAGVHEMLSPLITNAPTGLATRPSLRRLQHCHPIESSGRKTIQVDFGKGLPLAEVLARNGPATSK